MDGCCHRAILALQTTRGKHTPWRTEGVASPNFLLTVIRRRFPFEAKGEAHNAVRLETAGPEESQRWLSSGKVARRDLEMLHVRIHVPCLPTQGSRWVSSAFGWGKCLQNQEGSSWWHVSGVQPASAPQEWGITSG